MAKGKKAKNHLQIKKVIDSITFILPSLHTSGVHKSAESEPGGVYLPLPWSFFGQILAEIAVNPQELNVVLRLE